MVSNYNATRSRLHLAIFYVKNIFRDVLRERQVVAYRESQVILIDEKEELMHVAQYDKRNREVS
jgi:hypothetical protein